MGYRVINVHAKGKGAQSKEDKAMTNIFEETYEAMEEAKKAYAEATTDEGKEAAEKAYGEVKDRMADQGDLAWRIWRAYEHSRENENRILNFDDIIWDRDVEAITACLKENGIREFTYSCRATDAVETLWLFKEAGCTIGEMVEVNLRKDLWGKTYEKGHAFKMSIN
jgi:hypothetical protein